ncbi:unnamed protein product [Discula destructiva]
MTESVSLSPAVVTGGCGFTSSHLVEGLLLDTPNCEVRVTARNVRNQIPGVTYHKFDISSLEQVQAVFDSVKPKAVFHVTSPNSSVDQPAASWRVNVGGRKNLLLAAKDTKTVHAFV